MKVLVTGSAGHLGEALMRTLLAAGDEPVGIDIKRSLYTSYVGTIADRAFVSKGMEGIEAVVHTATLHKPHVATHTRQAFIDTNITGTLNLLEEAARVNVGAFIYTSTTSAFGDAMKATQGGPAVWVTETLQSTPKNIYGVTKCAAEDLCQLFHRNQKLPALVLRTSRFFPEEDDSREQRASYNDMNLKINELLHRRVDIEDIVTAHQLALTHCQNLPFDRYIISAPTPFNQTDIVELARDAPAVVSRYVPEYAAEYAQRSWTMFPEISRVYDSSKARTVLGWTPKYSFAHAIQCLAENRDYRSPLTSDIGSRGYHDTVFADGPYPIDN